MCDCPTQALARASAPARATVQFQKLENPPADCGKACTDGNSIAVDAKLWNRWTKSQQDAALAHELGHVHGAKCESCADHVAGAILRQWGYSRSEAMRALGAVVQTRPMAGAHAGRGWDAHGNVEVGQSTAETNKRRKSLDQVKASLLPPSMLKGALPPGSAPVAPPNPNPAPAPEPPKDIIDKREVSTLVVAGVLLALIAGIFFHGSVKP